jgi:hypothetical protein
MATASTHTVDSWSHTPLAFHHDRVTSNARSSDPTAQASTAAERRPSDDADSDEEDDAFIAKKLDELQSVVFGIFLPLVQDFLKGNWGLEKHRYIDTGSQPAPASRGPTPSRQSIVHATVDLQPALTSIVVGLIALAKVPRVKFSESARNGIADALAAAQERIQRSVVTARWPPRARMT